MNRVRRLTIVLVVCLSACNGVNVGSDADVDADDGDLRRDADRIADLDADVAIDTDPDQPDARDDAGLGQQRVVLVIIDGARYTETLGDSDRRFTPEIAALAEEGCAPGPILNTGQTVTIAGTSVIHTGVWDAWRENSENGEVYQAFPTHWEYLRGQLGLDASEAYFVLRFISDEALWKPSRHEDYGPELWPTIVAQGEVDEDVFDNTSGILEEESPLFTVLYLADVDHAGHSGLWTVYTATLQQADSIVGRLWRLIQELPDFAGRTTMFVTSDHGRHDDDNGGFQHHGDGCAGCREVTFLAIGPEIDPGCQSTSRTLADITPTIGALLGFEATFSDGEVMSEIFVR